MNKVITMMVIGIFLASSVMAAPVQVTTQANIQEQIQTQSRLTVQEQNGKSIVELSDGRKAEIKVQSEAAQEKAKERLKLKECNSDNECSIELKEIQNKLAYEIKAQKKFKLLGIFEFSGEVKAEISAENGSVIRTQKPLLAYLSTEVD